MLCQRAVDNLFPRLTLAPSFFLLRSAHASADGGAGPGPSSFWEACARPPSWLRRALTQACHAAPRNAPGTCASWSQKDKALPLNRFTLRANEPSGREGVRQATCSPDSAATGRSPSRRGAVGPEHTPSLTELQEACVSRPPSTDALVLAGTEDQSPALCRLPARLPPAARGLCGGDGAPPCRQAPSRGLLSGLGRALALPRVC